MPFAPPTPCRHPGCGKTSAGRFCDAHAKAERQRYDRQRGSAAKRGYGPRWRKARAAFLAKHPLCAECQGEGRPTPATVVDHIEPYKGDMRLFWDRNNWQPLCKPHHDRKTATEDGRWG